MLWCTYIFFNFIIVITVLNITISFSNQQIFVLIILLKQLINELNQHTYAHRHTYTHTHTHTRTHTYTEAHTHTYTEAPTHMSILTIRSLIYTT